MTPEKERYFRRLVGYAAEYKGFLFISSFGFALFAAMEASLVMTVEYFIRFLQNEPSKPIFYLSSEVTSSLLFVPVAIMVLSGLRGIGSYLGNYFMSRVGLNVVNTLRKMVFAHILFLPQKYHDTRNSGELVSLIIYNIDQVTQSVTEAIKILLRDGLSVIAILGFLVYKNWLLTLVFFFVAPILGVIIYAAGRYFRKKSTKIQDSVGAITHISTESFQGIKLVKSYRGEAHADQRFVDATNNNLNLQTKFQRAKALQTPILHTIIAAALAIIFFLVMKLWPPGDAAGAVAYVTYAGLIAKPFRQLASLNSMIQKGLAAAETIFTTLDIDQETDTGTKTLSQVRGHVEFKDVSFRYGDDLAPAISHLNLSIAPGETVALVGATGSGKSTIASLLLRFYEASEGDIHIDGVSIRDISLRSLRQHIALVNQQTILFNDSIRANIAYGEDIKSANDTEIQQAAENAHAKSFIERLEHGFDEGVGEDGSSLSGGQRQRISIARALLKNAPILILDEATSALDNESEKHIQQALETLKQGRTTLIIAHRLSTIENADRIVVLGDGKIIEEGDHRTLMAKNGYYARLQDIGGKAK